MCAVRITYTGTNANVPHCHMSVPNKYCHSRLPSHQVKALSGAQIFRASGQFAHFTVILQHHHR